MPSNSRSKIISCQEVRIYMAGEGANTNVSHHSRLHNPKVVQLHKSHKLTFLIHVTYADYCSLRVQIRIEMEFRLKLYSVVRTQSIVNGFLTTDSDDVAKH